MICGPCAVSERPFLPSIITYITLRGPAQDGLLLCVMPQWARHQPSPIFATHFGGNWLVGPGWADHTIFAHNRNRESRAVLHIESHLPSRSNPCVHLELAARCGPWPGAGKQTSQGEDTPGPGLGPRPRHAGRRGCKGTKRVREAAPGRARAMLWGGGM